MAMSEAYESLDQARVQGLAARARTVPGVREAVAVVRQGARAAAPAAASEEAQPAAPAEQAAPAKDPAPVARIRTDAPSSKIDGGELRIPEGAPVTLQAALKEAAELAPEKGTIYLRAGSEPDMQTYPELLAEAQRVLGGLRSAGLEPGDAALFQFDDHRAYMTAFWACILGGFVPTPVAVATTYAAPNESNRKLRGAWDLLDHPVVLTDEATAPALTEVRELWGESTVRILTVEQLLEHAPDTAWYATTGDSPVINLLTSGSTGMPKCVQHANHSVAHRAWAVAQGRGYTSDDVSLIWMPLDHVTMVYFNVRDMFLRCLHVNGRINDVLGDPLRWLDWLDQYGATNTWAPNFAFNLVNEYAEEIGKRSWDLSHVKELDNAGEPVIAATSHRFAELLAPHGLPADAVMPVWGMSETCSGVTYATQNRDDHTAGTVVVAPSSFEGELRILDQSSLGGPDAVSFSTVGRPLPGVTIRVVDDKGNLLPQGRIGELQIRGVTIMTGYYGNAEANRESFTADGWFRTGDLAFVHDGELVIAGRKKDQIIVRGANFVAHELESLVEQVDGVRVTFSAAAGVSEPGEGSDRLVIFFVPARWDQASLDQTFQDVRATLVREAGIAPDLLVPVAEADFPKTASGKIQRAALVKALKAGEFDDQIQKDAEPEAETAPPTWYFERQWAQLPDAVARTADGQTRLHFDTDCGPRVVFAEAEHLPLLGLADEQVVVVGRGEAFAEQEPDHYRVVPGDADHVRRVLAEVTAVYGRLHSVVFAWSLPGSDGTTAPADRLEATSKEVTAVIQALADGTYGHPLLLVLTQGAVHVQDGDTLDLGTCALPGLIRTAVAELPKETIRQLDLPAATDQWSAALRAELADPTHSGVVAARAGKRWQPRLRPVDEADANGAPPVKTGGLYLVTGGLGGIASDLAGYLLAGYGLSMLLVGRSEPQGEKAERLQDLSDFGSVLYRQLDVADAEALEAAVTEAEEHFGRSLDGVLHLAAADPTSQWKNLEDHALVRETHDTFVDLYHARVRGTLAVGRVLEDRPDASLVLFGSVNGEFGGHSFGAYSAASAFLVGFADHWRHDRGRDVQCLAWSMWTGVGVNKSQSAEPARLRGYRAIDPETGLRLFLTAAGLEQHYLMVGLDPENPQIQAELAPGELSAREVVLAYTADGIDPKTVQTALGDALTGIPVPVRLVEVTRIPTDANGAVDTTQLLIDASPKRAGARKEHVAPEGAVEQAIAGIWTDVLNQPAIGRDDSFFDVGGNSLRATRLLARITDTFGVRLTTNELYETPTVAGIAEALAAAGAAAAGVPETEVIAAG
ncbi:SDR family NAD(P)-dependent oxidoreductase [Streptomyces sp. NPDC059009]|uniref:SDR family NAD(P)-dependent oxidoreductase n=1 Tax=Streptomyces sp. NPDC059009 TaxID=3346694 RepID=UPI003684DA4B